MAQISWLTDHIVTTTDPVFQWKVNAKINTPTEIVTHMDDMQKTKKQNKKLYFFACHSALINGDSHRDIHADLRWKSFPQEISWRFVNYWVKRVFSLVWDLHRTVVTVCQIPLVLPTSMYLKFRVYESPSLKDL